MSRNDTTTEYNDEQYTKEDFTAVEYIGEGDHYHRFRVGDVLGATSHYGCKYCGHITQEEYAELHGGLHNADCPAKDESPLGV